MKTRGRDFQCGSSSHSDKVSPLKEDVNDDQTPINPPPLTDEAIRAALFKIAQAITTQSQAITAQAQAMASQANQEVVLQANQQVATLVCHLRDFTRMNPPTFYGSKVEKDPYEFIDEI